MGEKRDLGTASRRGFLTAAAGTGAAIAAIGPADAAVAPPAGDAAAAKGPVRFSLAAENAPPTAAEPLGDQRPGSDVMVDALRAVGIDYVAAMPGSSFRGLHESVLNHAGNQRPEWITCLHEETSVAMAHGYARAAGKPMAAAVHATVGLQHAVMPVYGTYLDRAPLMLITANQMDAAERRPGIEWQHSVQDAAVLVRDCTKWDDQPASLQHFVESVARAHRVATTLPMGPVLLVADAALQEAPVPAGARIAIPRAVAAAPPVGDAAQVRELARLLAGAAAPVLIADRCVRTQAGMDNLVALADLLGAAVVDRFTRFNFPTDHPLNHTTRQAAVIAEADVILGLEAVDFWGLTNRYFDNAVRSSEPATRPGAKLAALGMEDLLIKSNYQDFQRYISPDLTVTGDAQATLPALVAAVRAEMDADRRARAETRRGKLAAIFAKQRVADLEAAAVGWDASPVSTARMALELWGAIKNEDWVLASPTQFQSRWPQRLWDINKVAQYPIGAMAGSGECIGFALGVALAHRGSGRVVVNIQTDGDLMCSPGALWTAAHHKIPILIVMHNNRAYHQEVMHIQRMANRHLRGVDRANIGTAITDPDIDYAKLAQSLGVWAEGPVTSPGAVGSAIARALKVVKAGAPALVDIVSQPR